MGNFLAVAPQCESHPTASLSSYQDPLVPDTRQTREGNCPELVPGTRPSRPMRWGCLAPRQCLSVQILLLPSQRTGKDTMHLSLYGRDRAGLLGVWKPVYTRQSRNGSAASGHSKRWDFPVETLLGILGARSRTRNGSNRVRPNRVVNADLRRRGFVHARAAAELNR